MADFYKGKSLYTIDELDDSGIPHDNGYVKGMLYAGTKKDEFFLVGIYTDLDDANNLFLCKIPVDYDTVEKVKD